MSQPETVEKADETTQNPYGRTDGMSDLTYAIGVILGLSYPILAFSTGGRAVYQLFFKDGVVYYLPVILSTIAALCYLVATVGFAVRRKWAWWTSVGTLGFETTLTLVVGTLSFIIPAVIGRTVWRHYGVDYGYFPLIQPLLGLFWLLTPSVMRAYKINLWWGKDKESKPPVV